MRNKRGEEKVRRKKKEVITHAKKEEEGKQQTGRKGREKSRVKKKSWRKVFLWGGADEETRRSE